MKFSTKIWISLLCITCLQTRAQNHQPTISNPGVNGQPSLSISSHSWEGDGTCLEFPQHVHTSSNSVSENMISELVQSQHYYAQSSFLYPIPIPIESEWVCTFSEDFSSLPNSDHWVKKRPGWTYPSYQIDITEDCSEGMLYYSDDNFRTKYGLLYMDIKPESGTFSDETTQSWFRCAPDGTSEENPYHFSYDYSYTGAALTGLGSHNWADDDGDSLMLHGQNAASPFIGPTIIEGRMRVPNGRGMLSAFWANTGNEIDVFEFFGQNQSLDEGGRWECSPTDPDAQNNSSLCSSTEVLQNNYHDDRYHRDCPKSFIILDAQGRVVEFSDNFHIYTLEFSPSYYRFYIDGVLIREETKFKLADGTKVGLEPGDYLPDEILYENLAFPVNLRGSNPWRPYLTATIQPGNFPDKIYDQPTSLQIDYIRIFHKRLNEKNHPHYAEIVNTPACLPDQLSFTVESIHRSPNMYQPYADVQRVEWSTSPGIDVVDSSPQGITIRRTGQISSTEYIDAEVYMLSGPTHESPITIRKQINSIDFLRLPTGTINEPSRGQNLEDFNEVSSSQFSVELDFNFPMTAEHLERTSRGIDREVAEESAHPFVEIEVETTDPNTTYYVSYDKKEINIRALYPGETVTVKVVNSRDGCKFDRTYTITHKERGGGVDIFKTGSDISNINDQFTISPNPTTTGITYLKNNGTSKGEYELLNATLQLIPIQGISQSQTLSKIDISHLPSGVYFLRIKSVAPNSVIIKKIIKK